MFYFPDAWPAVRWLVLALVIMTRPVAVMSEEIPPNSKALVDHSRRSRSPDFLHQVIASTFPCRKSNMANLDYMYRFSTENPIVFEAGWDKAMEWGRLCTKLIYPHTRRDEAMFTLLQEPEHKDSMTKSILGVTEEMMKSLQVSMNEWPKQDKEVHESLLSMELELLRAIRVVHVFHRDMDLQSKPRIL